MWDIVWVSPQGHRLVSVSRHFLQQAQQCPCSVRKQLAETTVLSKHECRLLESFSPSFILGTPMANQHSKAIMPIAAKATSSGRLMWTSIDCFKEIRR